MLDYMVPPWPDAVVRFLCSFAAVALTEVPFTAVPNQLRLSKHLQVVRNVFSSVAVMVSPPLTPLKTVKFCSQNCIGNICSTVHVSQDGRAFRRTHKWPTNWVRS